MVLVDAHREWKKRENEVPGDGVNGSTVENGGGVPGGKKRGRIRGFMDMLRRATGSKE